MLEKIEKDSFGEMYRHYVSRTNRHIGLVQKYCDKLSGVFNLWMLSELGDVHDASKFGPDELEPYVWLTWRYKCKDDGVECRLPNGMEDRITKATEHHILSNAHHPEFHQKRRSGLLNPSDRDKPPVEVIDATAMSNLFIAEMVADWLAMSEERRTDPYDWAKKNVNIRWKFTDPQVEFIYKLIDHGWGG